MGGGGSIVCAVRADDYERVSCAQPEQNSLYMVGSTQLYVIETSAGDIH